MPARDEDRVGRKPEDGNDGSRVAVLPLLLILILLFLSPLLYDLLQWLQGFLAAQ